MIVSKTLVSNYTPTSSVTPPLQVLPTLGSVFLSNFSHSDESVIIYICIFLARMILNTFLYVYWVEENITTAKERISKPEYRFVEITQNITQREKQDDEINIK